jgi:hypothetical protein
MGAPLGRESWFVQKQVDVWAVYSTPKAISRGAAATGAAIRLLGSVHRSQIVIYSRHK